MKFNLGYNFSMPDWAGKSLGKIQVNRLVARGGMAEVYTGRHESFGEVAIKVMRGLLDKDSDQLARFQREAEVIEELRHPNIVQMFYYDIIDENPYLVMEYVRGPSLAIYLKSLHDQKQRLPIGMVAQILNSIASALDYAHAAGIVHRDIKPANVLLRSQEGEVRLNEPLPRDVEPVLTDFGLVRLLDSTMHTTAGAVSGTPTYMSPEQARGEKVDKRSDIYSLGVMLYELLAGTVPFQADTTFGMLMKQINEPPPPIPGLSLELQAVLDRTLAKDPALRYENAGDLAKEFFALFNGQTISPGTLHMAQLAREAADGSKQAAPRQEDRRSSRWIRVGVEIVIAIVLALAIIQFLRPASSFVTATPSAPNPNTPVGRVRFGDTNFYVDNAEINLPNIPQPASGTHYEAWFFSDDGATIRDLGSIEFSATGSGRLVVNDPDAKNFLGLFNEVMITLEQDDAQISEPTGEVLYSSVLPPQSLVHMRHVLSSYSDLPDQGPLMQNLWWYNAFYIDRSINGDQFDEDYKIGITQAFESGDEATLRKRTEEVINTIVGSMSTQYQDYDEDGTVDIPEGSDGYGSLPNGDRLGYLQDTALHAKYAADAPDSTPNIRLHGENIQICIQNISGWTEELLPLAIQLSETPFGPEMEPIIAEMSALGQVLLKGEDANENGQFDEAIAGECGATAAYDYAYRMADMVIYPGPDRIPPPER
ncbi:MAG TPA: protein kinase [Anaerolineales bacterium]|nr:protein kinase [Anaerolineales bacterium]